MIRGPTWAFAASPTRTGELVIAYSVKEGSTVAHDLRVIRSHNGGTSWSGPEPVGDYTTPDVHRFGPTLAVLGDGSLVVEFYQHDTTNKAVTGHVGLWNAKDATWDVRLRNNPFDFDLTQAPYKCGNSANTHFIGDYRVFTGGVTRVHSLRAEPSIGCGTGPGSATCLFTAAVSESTY